MQVIRAVGREAASRKYDMLSALMAFALSQDPHRQRLVLRFAALVTTRYNWQRNELTMGQREISRLWCVDERTVKRDMARLRADGWVEVRRQGTRGRVSVLAFAWDRIMADTRPAWANIGQDFIDRAGAGDHVAGDHGGAGGADGPTVVPFRRPMIGGNLDAGMNDDSSGVWADAATHLQAEDAALFAAWFRSLSDAGTKGGSLHLVAPTRFQASYIQTHLHARLLRAVQRADPAVRGVTVSAL